MGLDEVTSRVHGGRRIGSRMCGLKHIGVEYRGPIKGKDWLRVEGWESGSASGAVGWKTSSVGYTWGFKAAES